jgi:mannose-6-phosphate isomerase class I
MKPATGILTGTPSQIEWAERIRPRVDAEFSRVANALTVAASHRGEQVQLDTKAVIAILEEKRAEVMAKSLAGYFIHDWQELNDQVRQMIWRDPRYQAIQTRRTAQQG